MGVFCRRPLAAGCLMLILGVILSLAVPILSLVLLACAAALSGWVIFRTVRYKLSYRRLYLLLVLLGLFLGCGRTLLTVKTVHEPLIRHAGEHVTVKCAVEEVRYSGSYSAALTVGMWELNGESASGKALLLLDGASPYLEGDVVTGAFLLQTLEQAEVDSPASYRADGCAVALKPAGEAPLAVEKSGFHGPRAVMGQLRGYFADILHAHLPEAEGNLLSALLLGAREELSDLTVRHFRRAGASHLLALSGLHLGILAAILDRFLSILQTSKAFRMSAVLGTMGVYLFLTGCSFSMLRAVFMLAAVYLSSGFGENGDPVTALLGAGAVILLITPVAVYSASYQMTMLATFGILAFQGVFRAIDRRLPRRGRWKRRLMLPVRALLSSLLITLFASVAVLPVQWLTFGELSLVTPLTNLILIPLATPLLVLGLLVLFAYPAPLFAALAAPLAKLLLLATERLGNTDSTVSLSFDFVPFVFVPFFAVMLVLLFVDLKHHKVQVLLPVAAVIFAFALCLAVHRQANDRLLWGCYRTENGSESIALSHTDGCVLIDISSGSAARLESGWRRLHAEGNTELDMLVLSHYHDAHARAVARFARRVLVRALYVPTPTTDAEEEILARLKAEAEALGIAVTVFSTDAVLTLFDAGTLCLSAPLYENHSTQPAFRLDIAYGNGTLRYESAAYGEFLRHTGAPSSPTATTVYVPGVHGPKPREPLAAVAADGVATTVLVGNSDIALLMPWSSEEAYVYYGTEHSFVFE